MSSTDITDTDDGISGQRYKNNIHTYLNQIETNKNTNVEEYVA